MVISQIWCAMILVSILFSFFTGTGSSLSAAAMEGAHSGVTLAISIAGSLCLWSGIGRLIEKVGITQLLSRCLKPALHLLFPETRYDSALAGDLSANICANLLGLGNAATPMGLSAARRLKQGSSATDSLCRLIVLNTASIQLIPSNVAALRAGLGCGRPFDILPAVWITSFCSAGIGLTAAWCMGRLWKT